MLGYNLALSGGRREYGETRLPGDQIGEVAHALTPQLTDLGALGAECYGLSAGRPS